MVPDAPILTATPSTRRSSRILDRSKRHDTSMANEDEENISPNEASEGNSDFIEEATMVTPSMKGPPPSNGRMTPSESIEEKDGSTASPIPIANSSTHVPRAESDSSLDSRQSHVAMVSSSSHTTTATMGTSNGIPPPHTSAPSSQERSRSTSRRTTTTTSRRGGRVGGRSRSPITSYGPPPARLPPRRDSVQSISNPPTTISSESAEEASSQPGGPMHSSGSKNGPSSIPPPPSQPPIPPNPSSAAAAAAAAAKRLCDPPSQHWYNKHAPEELESAAAAEAASSYHGNGMSSKQPLWHHSRSINGGSRGGSGFVMGTENRRSSSRNYRRNEQEEEEVSDDDNVYGNGDGRHYSAQSRERSGTFRRHTLQHGRDEEDSDGGEGGRGAEMGSFNVELCSPSRVINRITRSNDEFKKHVIGRGGTSQIMGSAAPIHMPRRGFDLNDDNSVHEGGDEEHNRKEMHGPSSVFRERSGVSKEAAEESSPQRILMSLRTDTRSFDLKSPVVKSKVSLVDSSRKKEQDESLSLAPLSPEAPPQIQNSRRANTSNFEPQKTPRTPLGIKSPLQSFKSPTFTLFGRSFDSLTDQLLPANSSLLPLMPMDEESSPKKVQIDFDGASVPFSPHVRSKSKIGASSSFLNSPGGISLGNAFDVPLTPHTPQTKEMLSIKSVGDGDDAVFHQKDSIPDSQIEGFLKKSSSNGDKGRKLPKARSHTKSDSDSSVLFDTQNSFARHPSYVPSGSQINATEKPQKIYIPPKKSKSVTIDIKSNQRRSPQNVFREKPPISGVKYHRDVKHKIDSSPTNPNGRNVSTGAHQSETSSRNRYPERVRRASPYSMHRDYRRKDRPQQTRKHDIFSERSRPSLSGMDASVFYKRLLSHKYAFENYTFLLPSLKSALYPEINIKGEVSSETKEGATPERTVDTSIKAKGCTPDHPPSSMATVSYSPETKVSNGEKEHDSSQYAVAQRRVTSAICAFGGKIFQKNPRQSQEIFREKNESESSVSKEKSKYEKILSNRYYENENRISWEIEEDPPVEIFDSIGSSESLRKSAGSPGLKRSSPSPNEKNLAKRPKISNEVKDSKKNHNEASNSGSDQPKMKYRCKLCGQPKQNHTCPYQQSLQRSIGVMVHTAVNAFTSCEPGILAPALSEMNNFVLGQENHTVENTPGRPGMSTFGPPSMMSRHVTPEVMRGPIHHSMRRRGSSPGSFSDHSYTPHRPPYRVNPYSQVPVGSSMVSQPTPGSLRRKRVISPGSSTSSTTPSGSASDLLFVDASDLRPEQFRIISSQPKGDFKYPQLPLPYGQRKNLSDTLFALSKEISQLTDECAIVLREAREKDMWDSAVAELLTQVVVVIHCPEDDKHLEGLSLYLLSLGFAC